MASFCKGISYASNTSCHETPGKIKEILAILESCRPSYSSSFGNVFCEVISSTINFNCGRDTSGPTQIFCSKSF
uniref:Uncharacterized protein n=1 Tax=Medicago truncatula TaxID=3880 RepID=I3S7U0_MEDTR|nr:unknown [Medicago truncatula]